MRILLLRPSQETSFGLAPFFQTEPLGLMYLAAALRPAGHSVTLADMRFERRSIAAILRDCQPDLVAISCLHILEAPDVAPAGRPDQGAQSKDFCRPWRPRNLRLPQSRGSQPVGRRNLRRRRRGAAAGTVRRHRQRSPAGNASISAASERRRAVSSDRRETGPRGSIWLRCPFRIGPSLPATRSAIAV